MVNEHGGAIRSPPKRDKMGQGIGNNPTIIILLYVILERGVEQQGISNALDPDKELPRELFVPMSTHSYLSA